MAVESLPELELCHCRICEGGVFPPRRRGLLWGACSPLGAFSRIPRGFDFPARGFLWAEESRRSRLCEGAARPQRAGPSRLLFCVCF